MGKQRTRKRRGRPGSVSAPPPQRVAPAVSRAPRPAVDPPATPPAAADPPRDRWSVPTWLMLAATAWSCFILWRALFNWDQSPIGAAGGARPWMLPVMIVVSGVSSFVAFRMLRNGTPNIVRLPLWIAALTGMQGILVSGCALFSLWLLWRARLAEKYPEINGPNRRRKRD